jgi:tRNA dimethylallyltransferase
MVRRASRGKADNAASSTKGVVVIAGPTASGKSALALDLAANLGGVVINADAMQTYRDLPILTAQPTPADMAAIDHRLYGFLESTSTLSAGAWASLATSEIEIALAAGKIPIVVGGSGLYLRALIGGLSPVPAVPLDKREEARALLREIGSPALHQRLAAIDPSIAARLHPNDSQRIVRAWEVYAATGVALSSWQSKRPEAGLRQPSIAILCLPERPDLLRAIDARVQAMVQASVLAEVAAVLKMAPACMLERGAGRALGFAELARYLANEMTLADAVAALQKKTRQYAKRQMTWARHQFRFGNIITLNEMFTQLSPNKKHNLRYKIRNFLLTE